MNCPMPQGHCLVRWSYMLHSAAHLNTTAFTHLKSETTSKTHRSSVSYFWYDIDIRAPIIRPYLILFWWAETLGYQVIYKLRGVKKEAGPELSHLQHKIYIDQIGVQSSLIQYRIGPYWSCSASTIVGLIKHSYPQHGRVTSQGLSHFIFIPLMERFQK